MKKLIVSVCMLALVLSLTACSGKGGKEINVDIAKLAQDLNSQAVTSDTLTSTAAEMLASIYFVDAEQIEAGTAYTSSGSTSCEVAVFQCKQASQTAEVEKLFKNRVSNQSTLFSTYAPDEVTKLDNAIIKTAGKYAVLCVCDDKAKAESILKEYGF